MLMTVVPESTPAFFAEKPFFHSRPIFYEMSDFGVRLSTRRPVFSRHLFLCVDLFDRVFRCLKSTYALSKTTTSPCWRARGHCGLEECSRGSASECRRGWKGCRRYRSGSAHGQMGIDHGNDMACGAERTGLDPVLPGKVFDDSVRYPTCNLGENGHLMLCRCHGSHIVAWWLPLRCP